MVLGLFASPALAAHPHKHPAGCPRHLITATDFRSFSAAVWEDTHWRRGLPPAPIIADFHREIHCSAGPGHRQAMQERWQRDRAAFLAYRKVMLWRERFKPFVYPDGKRWAVPYPIAWCESGGDYFVGPSGAYGLIPPFPQYMSPRAQDEVAHRLYLEAGEGPWAPYEGGCAYR